MRTEGAIYGRQPLGNGYKGEEDEEEGWGGVVFRPARLIET